MRPRSLDRWQPPCHSSGIISGGVSPNQDHISHKLHCFLPPSSLPLASVKKINMLEMSFPALFLSFPPSAVEINLSPVSVHFLFTRKTTTLVLFMYRWRSFSIVNCMGCNGKSIKMICLCGIVSQKRYGAM